MRQRSSYKEHSKRTEKEESLLFNSINAHQNSWCPYAECHNSPLCEPCRQRYLFILSPGRAGSTSLLTTFNLLPNVRLSGENNNELFKAYQMIHNLDKADNRFKDDENKEEGPWMHNAVPRQSLACSSQKILSTINPPSHDFLKSLKHRKDLKRHEFDTIIGAKMIRIQGGFWDPQHAVDYFKEHFPCAKYIVNSRDPMGILSSRSRLGWMNADLEHLESIKRKFSFSNEMQLKWVLIVLYSCKWKNGSMILVL